MKDMPYKLKITFEGLHGLVYNNKEKAMTVLLADGRKPGTSTDKKRHLPHIPSITFAANDLDGNTEEEKLNKFDFFTVNQQRGKDVFLTLDGDDLEVRPIGSGSFSNEPISLPANFKDLVVTMDRIYPPNGIRVNPKLLNQELDSTLVGRMRFTTGDVTLEDVLSYNYEFESGHVYHGVARRIVLTISSSAEKVELRSKNQNLSCILKLRKDENHKKMVEISITNVPARYIDVVDPFSRDFDFEMVYRMADPADLKKLNTLYVPKKQKATSAIPAQPDGHVCGGIIFNDDDLA